MSSPVRHAVLSTLLLAACGGGAGIPADATAPAIQVTPAMIAVVDSFRLESGPVISGTLVAERVAQLRPQVSGALIALYVREGDAVRAGQPLAVIDTLVLADQARSAQLASRSADLAAETAARNLGRSEELHRAGAIALRDLENARDAVAQVEAAREDARARLAAARKQLANATVRAPFAGVVSEVPVSVGDIVSSTSATPIAVVVDPGVLELEGSVPASSLGAVQRGAAVEFAVPSQPGIRIRGTIARINPAVDAATGQVRLYVRVPNADRSLAAGLFAEGRVSVESRRALAVPLAAVDGAAIPPVIRRVTGGIVEEVAVTFGLRDELAERVEVSGPIAAGDTVLIGGALGTPVGTSVRVTRADS
jgi:RND family efflux transporter MFP subunit